MLRCPKCKCLYNDETQKFCTGDGTRLLSTDQAVDEAATENKAGRRTPTGELLFETYILPPAGATAKKAVSSKGKPSYQMFGLHTGDLTKASTENGATNGFHSFDYLVVKDEAKLAPAQSVPELNKTLNRSYPSSNEPEKKSNFGPSFVLLCLLSALIFLTCLAFAASYFFSDQQKSPTLPVSRQTERSN